MVRRLRLARPLSGRRLIVFEVGSVVRATPAEDDSFRVGLSVDGAEFGVLAISTGYATVTLEVAGLRLSLARYGRGWNLVALDEDRQVRAHYSQPWVTKGRLAAGNTEMAVRAPVAWRPWRFLLGRRLVLDLDRHGDVVAGRIRHRPEQADPDLFFGFAAAVVWLRFRFRSPLMRPVHATEGHDGLADVFDDLGGDGGGDMGGGP
jgi:hypothetical protein